MNNEKWIICNFHVRPATFPPIPFLSCLPCFAKYLKCAFQDYNFISFFFFALHKCCHSETLRKILPSQQINCSLSSRPRESKIEIWKFWIETLRVCGKRKYPFIVDLTNFSLQFLQHFFKAVLGIFGCICRRLPLVWRRLCSDEFLEKLQPSETRQNKTIKKQTFSLSTRHSDEAETGQGMGRQAGDKGMSLLCRRHHLPVYPHRLPAHSALHFDNGYAPSGYALNFWLALPYPNWLTTHKQTASSPTSPPLPLSLPLHVAAYTWGLKLLWLSCNFTGWQWQ